MRRGITCSRQVAVAGRQRAPAPDALVTVAVEDAAEALAGGEVRRDRASTSGIVGSGVCR